MFFISPWIAHWLRKNQPYIQHIYPGKALFYNHLALFCMNTFLSISCVEMYLKWRKNSTIFIVCLESCLTNVTYDFILDQVKNYGIPVAMSEARCGPSTGDQTGYLGGGCAQLIHWQIAASVMTTLIHELHHSPRQYCLQFVQNREIKT